MRALLSKAWGMRAAAGAVVVGAVIVGVVTASNVGSLDDAGHRGGVAVLTAAQLDFVTDGGVTPAVFSTADHDGSVLDAVSAIVADHVLADAGRVDYASLLDSTADEIDQPVAFVAPDGVNSVSANHARPSWSMHATSDSETVSRTGLVSAEEAQAQAWEWLMERDGGVIAVIPQGMLDVPAPEPVDDITETEETP